MQTWREGDYFGVIVMDKTKKVLELIVTAEQLAAIKQYIRNCGLAYVAAHINECLN